ncbi:asparagine synthetase B [Bacillus sp. AFS002410]|uniref:asparagine synthase-related protein n=1 Tax=Bacillus sp. AFS002410 TaxID=2033481 RepID=UPI000BF1DFD1|nr:asparagine synthase-related protein [Bacillus sp. AFS002410]PEJ58441.1 asparagine synthetase B [Bacillus sp. AFS002410]
MSAITGIIHFNNEPVPTEYGNGLMKSLQKYPADDVQVWHKNNVLLGCHAQWITPESVGEQLPYYDYNRGLVITADAIIDNREELFDRLHIDKSYRKAMPDSHLILLAYEKWGEESPKYLAGDFAYIIWDEAKRLLFGARDFSGSRTLYYYNNMQKFAFCTIMNPLFTLPFIKKKINEQWLAEFISIPGNFESVNTSSTVYDSIRQIPPSHIIKIKDGNETISRYCELASVEKLKLKSDHEYEEAFREVYQNAVKARLRTHRQVGAHLSGGLDSGSVVSFAAKDLQKENKQLYTYSYVPVDGFVDWTYKNRVADERPFIQSTVQYVGNIRDHYLDFADRSPLSEVDDWLDVLEMPYKFFENTFWLSGIYEKAQQNDVGILLNGQRGNWTVSWGPFLDYQVTLLKKLNLVHFFKELHLYSKNLGVKKSRVFSVVRKKAFTSLKRYTPSEDYFPIIVNPQFAKKNGVIETLQEHGIDMNGYSNLNAYDMKKEQFDKLYYWSINGTYGTKLSLRHSVWDRDPTNDLQVIKFCLSVPEEQYVQNGLDRSLIRRSMKTYLPDKVRLNQRVRGVQGADGVHRMTSFWQQFIDELKLLCTDSMASDIFNIEVLKSSIKNIEGEPRPEYVFDLDFRFLMRSLIVYRFLKSVI